ncbi:hypothetical protein EV2_002920 [Malus domestica]
MQDWLRTEKPSAKRPSSPYRRTLPTTIQSFQKFPGDSLQPGAEDNRRREGGVGRKGEVYGGTRSLIR